MAPPGGDGPAAPGDPGLRFVEEGIVVPGEVGAEGVALTEGRVLVSRPWTPGEEVVVVGEAQRARAIAPAQAGCVLLFRLGLGDAPPTAMAFIQGGSSEDGGSEDGALLRIARGRREALVVDAWRGEPAVDGGAPALAEARRPLPSACPGERVVGEALVGPDHRLAVVEGPFQERSGETGWRIALFR